MRLRNIALILPLVGVCLPGPVRAQDNPQQSIAENAECRDVRLTRKPGWTLAGGFTADGSHLRVVDSLNRTVLDYGPSGESLGPVGGKTVQNALPISGQARGQQLILEGTDGLLLMDRNLRLIAKGKMTPVNEGWSVTALWGWAPVGKEDVVAFADIGYGSDPRDPARSKTAFVRFPLHNPGQLQILDAFDLSGTENKGYFRSTYSYMTGLGETAYYLSFNKGMKLYKHEKGKSHPEDVSALLPKGLASPPLPDWSTRQAFTDMLGRIEKASMPVGLFSNGRDALYLLYRTPQGKGTRWILYRIDPSGRQPVSNTDLPIHASHVTVVPGSKDWAFIEKGPALAWAAQDIPRILFIPSALLEAPLRPGSDICN